MGTKTMSAAAGTVVLTPSETLTSYAGAASPPSWTNWTWPAVTCAWVKEAIATPWFETSSKRPPVTPETLKVRPSAASSGSAALRVVPSRTTVAPSSMVRALMSSAGGSLTVPMLTVAVAMTLRLLSALPSSACTSIVRGGAAVGLGAVLS